MSKKWFTIPILCFVLVFVLFRGVIYIGYVPTESMEPTIHARSKLFGLRVFCELEVGDIIIFEYKGTCMVKRIAACPGDYVINTITQEELTVPKDSYYVLGDNSAKSYDSRYWEDPFIKRNDILAKCLKNYKQQ